MSEYYLSDDSNSNATYICTDSSGDGASCAANCVGLEDCLGCNCVVQPTYSGGAWGPVMDTILCLVPIIFLVVVTLIPKPVPTTVSLPVSALIMWVIRLAYLNSDVVLTNGCVIAGIHEALTPLSITAGAITLFETMEATLCMPYMMREMKALTSGHPVAEGMLIFSFCYMVEGASGFGTPAALGAPMLISLGHEPLASIVVLLVFNTLSAVWGATGTPLWFGLRKVDLTDAELLVVSQKSAVTLGIISLIVVPWTLLGLLSWKMLRMNGIFVYASLLSSIIPSIGIAFVSYDFPALLGGIVGTLLSSVLIKFSLGLKPIDSEMEQQLGRSVKDIGTVGEAFSVVKEFRASMLQSIQHQQHHQNQHSFSHEQSDESNCHDMTGTSKVITEEVSSPAPVLLAESNKRSSTDEVNKFAHFLDESDKVSTEEVNKSTTVLPSESESDMIASNNDEMASSAVDLGESTGSISCLQKDFVDEKLGPRKEWNDGYLQESLLRFFPIWGTVLLLIITRVEQIGLKPLLLKESPFFEIDLGSYGIFRLSVSVVFQLLNILSYPGLNWNYALFYVPFVIPFILASSITFLIFRKNIQASPLEVCRTVLGRLRNPAIALIGALILVELLIRGEESSPAFIIGENFSNWFKQGFIVISPILGVLGSFFSGSTTLSNLTFGGIQTIAAERIGISVTSMLALQMVGAAAGNCLALNNIISVCAVASFNIAEGKIIAITYKYTFAMTTIATVVILAIFIRF